MSDRLTIKFNVEEQTLEMNEVIRFIIGGVALHLDKDSGILSLLDNKGNILSQVDFPTEKIITNAYYDYNTQELVLEFENSPSVRIPIEINFDNYYNKNETKDLLLQKQDKLSAGEGIIISEDGTISINYPNGDELTYGE